MVISFFSTSRLRCFCAIMILLFLLPCQAWSMDYYWGSHPQKDRLVFTFSSTIPTFTLQRTGTKTLSLTLPKDIWNKEAHPEAVALDASRMIDQVTRDKNILFIRLKTPAFGFIYFPLVPSNKLVVDIFRDPMGAQWKSPVAHKQVATASRPIPSHVTTQPKTTPPKEAAVSTPPASATTLPSGPDRKDITTAVTNPKTRRFMVEQPADRPLVVQNIAASTSPLNTHGPEKDTNAGMTEHQQTTPATNPPGSFRFKVKRQDAEHAFAMDDLNTTTEDATDRSEQGPHLNLPSPQAIPTPPPVLQAPPRVLARHGVNATTNATKAPDNGTLSTPVAAAAPQPTPEANATAEPKFKELLASIKATMDEKNLDMNLVNLQGMLRHPKFPDAMREETLYLVAEILFQKYHNDIKNHFQEVMSAFQAAVSYNPKSLRLSSALLSMGLANLKVGNIPEANAYFKLVRTKYPNDSNTPLTYYYMGDHYLQNKEYQKAADNFQYVVQKYPDSAMSQASAIGLTKALKELGFYTQAFEIMDYAAKRWPRHYVNDPEFLMLSGYIELKNHALERAKESFWLYINLVPEGKNMDIALARIGDIYVMSGKKKSAREIYERAAQMYPDKEGGLIAKMRLAEEGVFDTPSLKKMFSVFDRPYSLRPKEVYTQIIEKYPKSPLAPVAQLKLAMWQFWSNSLLQTLETVDSFAKKYPDQELLPKALTVGRKAFAQWVAQSIPNGRFKNIIDTWKKYPFLHQETDPETRLAIATSFWKTGFGDQALELAEPFLSGAIPLNASSGPALDLVLAILVKSQSWQNILDMTKNVRAWDLPKARRRQFEYTQALAHENLGTTDQSHPLWIKLASDIELDDSQRAYALYFLAKHAEQAKDLEQEYMMAQQALSLFLGMPQRDTAKIRDCLNMLTQVTSRSHRIQEALGWAIEYEKYIAKDDPAWPEHMYTLANLFKLNQDKKMWKKKLESIIKQYPDSIYRKMAAADLESALLQKEMQPFE